MLYTLLGKLAWRIGKRYVRKRAATAPSRLPKPLLGAAAAATVGGALLVMQRRAGRSAG